MLFGGPGMRYRYYIFIISLFVLIHPVAVFSATIHVPAAQPTIQAGIDAATDGDTVLVAPGFYQESVNFLGKKIKLCSSEGAEASTIQGTGDVETISFTNNEPKGAEIKGFTITGGNRSGIYCVGSSPTIIDNIIIENFSIETNFGGGITLRNTSNSLIRNNVICGNRAAMYGAALHIGDNDIASQNDTISYNVIYDNYGFAVIRSLGNVQDLQINNNTIWTTDGGDGILHQGNGTLYLRNNIITHASRFGVYHPIEAGPIVAVYNCTYNNQTNYNFTPGSENIFADAAFLDTTNKDFNLAYSSPCIDAGDPGPQYNDPDGTRNDMGALPTHYQFPMALEIDMGNPTKPHYSFSLSPIIAWQYRDRDSTIQVQYDIEIGIDNEWTFAEMWASGPISSNNTETAYAGLPLADNETYYLRIRLNNGAHWGEWAYTWFRTHLIAEVIIVPLDFTTIQTAIDIALDFDTVLVKEGTYHESIDFRGKKIIVKSEGGPRLTIITNDPPADLVIFDENETRNSILEGFTLEGGSKSIYCTNAGPTIRRNILRDQSITDWASISLTGIAPALIENNTIVNSQNGAISTFSTVAPVIRNNIIAFNRGYGIHTDDVEPELFYNDVYQNSNYNYYNFYYAGIGDICADPLLRVDCSISYDSPCINAGDPDPAYNDPDGSRNDMGAIPYSFCGDLRRDGNINILDITYLINFMYKQGPQPDPPQSADVDHSSCQQNIGGVLSG